MAEELICYTFLGASIGVVVCPDNQLSTDNEVLQSESDVLNKQLRYLLITGNLCIEISAELIFSPS